ncbi:rho GTPase-activating protein 44 isoform X2 [Nematostella vectensis]|nr:rho GTPase-activating protein 44 isoform X2 [Nematostella vectensis]
MKKQFYRVKQLADQKVGRAEKTEILSVDLQNVEKTVDKIKTACQSASKRISASMQGSGSDFERRLRKLNQTGLANSMLESSNQLGDMSLLGMVLSQTGEAQLSIARSLCEFEMSVEKNVMIPMTTILENDIPNIYQAKKKLSKAALEMDTCKSRYLAALKTFQGASKDPWGAQSKADALKEELENETAKFEACQDGFTTEALTFVAREAEFAEWMIKFIEAQQEYHKSASMILQDVLPLLKTQVESSSLRSVFGCPLEEHLKVQRRSIAFVLEECLTYLHEEALQEQGLFRMAGSSGKIRKLKAAFDAGMVDLTEFDCDVHAITGVLKQYLRELPEPLMTFALYDDWIQAASIQDSGARLQAYWGLVDKLPKANKDNLRYLICFLGKLADYSEVNKMTASNIAIVIAPNIIYSEQDTSDAINLHHTGVQSSIVEALIQHHSWFFPEGVDFFRPAHVSTNGSSPASASPTPPRFESANDASADPGATKQAPVREGMAGKEVSTEEFQSVTGGLLDEVVDMINKNNDSEPEEGRATTPDATKIPQNQQAQPPLRTHSNSSSAPQARGAAQFVTTQEKPKRPAPTPSQTQVKYMGSTSPVATSPPPHPPPPAHHVNKPGVPPPPPPSKTGKSKP